MATFFVSAEILIVPITKLPVTAENLAKVTSVIWLKKPDNSALLIEHDPDSNQDFEVLNLFSGIAGIKQIGQGGIETIAKILAAITGQPFDLVVDNDQQLHYRRRDFHGIILAHEMA